MSTAMTDLILYVFINSKYTTSVLVNLMEDNHLYKGKVLLKFQLENLQNLQQY